MSGLPTQHTAELPHRLHDRNLWGSRCLEERVEQEQACHGSEAIVDGLVRRLVGIHAGLLSEQMAKLGKMTQATWSINEKEVEDRGRDRALPLPSTLWHIIWLLLYLIFASQLRSSVLEDMDTGFVRGTLHKRAPFKYAGDDNLAENDTRILDDEGAYSSFFALRLPFRTHFLPLEQEDVIDNLRKADVRSRKLNALLARVVIGLSFALSVSCTFLMRCRLICVQTYHIPSERKYRRPYYQPRPILSSIPNSATSSCNTFHALPSTSPRKPHPTIYTRTLHHPHLAPFQFPTRLRRLVPPKLQAHRRLCSGSTCA
jgi:hypothetical protein